MREGEALELARSLDDWMHARGYTGWDPHDLLSSPVVRGLSFGSRWLAIAWTQLGVRSPIQLRGILGVPRVRNAKGIGLALAAHVRLFEATGDPRWRNGARRFVDWLSANAVRAVHGVGWGYPFPWANRAFYVPANTPSSVVTSFAAQALLDAAERLGFEDAGRLAHRAGGFLERNLHRIPGADGTFCFSYTPDDRRAVHNANALVASTLARLAVAPGEASVRGGYVPSREALAEAALGAARFTARAQRSDGSWPYGTAARDRWVDSFHTSYTLVALRHVREALRTTEFDGEIAAGLDFWADTFLEEDTVRYARDSRYPIDVHAMAHSAITLLEFADRVPDALSRARALLGWCAREMRDPEGYFYFRRYRRYRNRLAYMRWTQSWVLRALGGMARAEARRRGER